MPASVKGAERMLNALEPLLVSIHIYIEGTEIHFNTVTMVPLKKIHCVM